MGEPDGDPRLILADWHRTYAEVMRAYPECSEAHRLTSVLLDASYAALLALDANAQHTQGRRQGAGMPEQP